MVLTFNCKQDGQCYVLDSERQAQYIVKISHSPRLLGGVYDDLGLSCLVGVEETQEGFLVSAFDTPLGVFKPQTDCLYRMQGEGWEITGNGNSYTLSHSGEAVANISITGTEVTISTENSGQAIMVIASALVALEYSKAETKREKSQESVSAAPKKEVSKKSAQKAKKNKEPIITINTEALKERLEKYKLDKAVTVATDLIPAIRFRVAGKTLIAMVSAIALCLVLFITGLVATAVKTSNAQNVEWSEATVSVKKSGETIATFKVGDYAYSITLRGYDFKDKEKFLIYYTEKSDGTLNKYFMKKPSSSGYVGLSVVSIVLAVIIFVFMFIGNPFEKRPEWDIRSLIKKLRPVPQQNEEDRIVEHTAYVTPADAEPDFFGVESDKKDNQ